MIGFAFGHLGDGVGGFEVERTQTMTRGRERQFGTFGVNVLVRLPVRLHGTRLYASAGAGMAYTNFGIAAKVARAGSLQLRLDYRIFRFPQEARMEAAHRLGVGFTLPF